MFAAAIAMLVATIWHGKYIDYFLLTWVPPAVAVVAMLFIGARPAALAGAALVIAGITVNLLGVEYWRYS